MTNENTKEEEQQYCEKIIDLKSSSDILADSLQEARLKIATEQGFMLLDVIGEDPRRISHQKRRAAKSSPFLICTQYSGH